MKSSFFALLFLFFQYTLWVGETSVWKMLRLNQKIAEQQSYNQQLSKKSLRLKNEINALQTHSSQSSSLAEDYIRWKLGFVKDEEWFCHF